MEKWGIELRASGDKRHHFIFLDGHFSHLGVDMLDMLAEEFGIHVIFIPSHLSHLLQPADRALQACLKAHISDEWDTLVRSLNDSRMDIALVMKVRTWRTQAHSQREPLTMRSLC